MSVNLSVESKAQFIADLTSRHVSYQGLKVAKCHITLMRLLKKCLKKIITKT